VETRASVTMAALTLARRLSRGVSIPGEQRTYLFGGGALLSGHVTDDIGATGAACTFYFACGKAQPARTERHSIHRGALTGGSASMPARAASAGSASSGTRWASGRTPGR
jgi:hypothetical protein